MPSSQVKRSVAKLVNTVSTCQPVIYVHLLHFDNLLKLSYLQSKCLQHQYGPPLLLHAMVFPDSV